MKILLTGGAGFIGSHLCGRLLDDGHEVVVLDDLSLGKVENLQDFSKNPDLRTEIGNINDDAFLDSVFSGANFDAVFHLAANSDVMRGSQDSRLDLERTFMTTFNLLEKTKKFSVKKMIFASSSAVYGPAEGKLGEDHGPLLPVSGYGAAKLASEAFISVASDNHGLHAWIFRFPNVVGARATHGVIFDFLNKLKKTPDTLHVLGDGSQCKPYIHVSDLVDGMLFGWKNSTGKMNVFNLAAEGRTTVREIAEMAVGEASPGAKIVYGSGRIGWVGDVPHFDYDISRISSLGWKARHTSNEAVLLAIREILGASGK